MLVVFDFVTSDKTANNRVTPRIIFFFTKNKTLREIFVFFFLLFNYNDDRFLDDLAGLSKLITFRRSRRDNGRHFRNGRHQAYNFFYHQILVNHNRIITVVVYTEINHIKTYHEHRGLNTCAYQIIC